MLDRSPLPRVWLPEVVVQLVDRVESRLDEPWSLERMADEARFSSFHFHRMFRRATGETPASFLERLRLERAALMLLASDRPITELALVTGFRRPETFARRFKTRFGVPARDYRREQIRLWSELGLEAGRDPLAGPGEIRVRRLPPMTVEVRRSLGEDEGFTFGEDSPPWSDWESRGGSRIGAMLDWPGITPPGRVRQDWCRVLDDRSLADGWVRREVGGGRYATLSVDGAGPVHPTVYQRLFVWAMDGRYRVRPGPTLEMERDGQLTVCQPVGEIHEMTTSREV